VREKDRKLRGKGFQMLSVWLCFGWKKQIHLGCWVQL